MVGRGLVGFGAVRQLGLGTVSSDELRRGSYGEVRHGLAVQVGSWCGTLSCGKAVAVRLVRLC